MNFKKLLVITTLLFLINTLYANDMVLSIKNGANITLHDDNTWEFENKNEPDIEEDVDITLGDKRIILISTDFTWRFIKESELKKKPNISITRILGQGMAQDIDLTKAIAIASKKAIEKATYKFKTSFKKKKFNVATLKDCIKRVEKDADTSETFIQNKGWKAQVQIVLDKGSILAVLNCGSKKEK